MAHITNDGASRSGYSTLSAFFESVTPTSLEQDGSTVDPNGASQEGRAGSGPAAPPRIAQPLKKIPVEMRAIIFEAMLSETSSGLRVSIKEQIRTQEIGNQARIQEMTRINEQQMVNRIKQASSRSRSWVFKIFSTAARALTAIPAVGPVLGSMVTKVFIMGRPPSVMDVGVALVVLASALKPLSDLGLLCEGEDREFKDVLGGPSWVAALLTNNLGALGELTDNKDEATAVAVLGTFFSLVLSAEAASLGARGGFDESAEIQSYLKLGLELGVVADGLGQIGQGNETLYQADLRLDQSQSEARLTEYKAVTVQNEARTQDRLVLLASLVKLDIASFRFATEVTHIANQTLSAVWGGAEESARPAMA